MNKGSPSSYFRTSPELDRLGVMLYVRLPWSLRNAEVIHKRGIEFSHGTVATSRATGVAQGCELEIF